MSKLIYVVDDESNIRTMMQLFLENEGFTVETFKDGQEAPFLPASLPPAGNVFLHSAYKFQCLCLAVSIEQLFCCCCFCEAVLL